MKRTINAFLANNRGNIAIISALAAPLLIGAGALGVDVASWETAQKNMQGAADMAAYSGGLAYAKGDANIATQAKSVAANTGGGFVDGVSHATVTVNSPPTSGRNQNTTGAIEVIISKPQPLFLAGLFLRNPVTVSARAVSIPTGAANGCLIALDQGNPPNVTGIVGAGSGGLNVSGGGTMNLSKCDVFVNATNSSSIMVTGGGKLQADNIIADGGTSGTITANKSLITNHRPAAGDPYATTRSIPSWSITGCDSTTKPSGQVANSTGLKVYCSGITISNPVTFASGVYIINGGMTATSTITGTGVTFILSSKSPVSASLNVFSMKAGTTMNLTAPTSGTTAGIVFWADGALPHAADNFFASSVSNITGAVYLPSHMVNYSGSALANSSCFQLVADEISISGAANFTHLNCSGVNILSPMLVNDAQVVE